MQVLRLVEGRDHRIVHDHRPDGVQGCVESDQPLPRSEGALVGRQEGHVSSRGIDLVVDALDKNGTEALGVEQDQGVALIHDERGGTLKLQRVRGVYRPRRDPDRVRVVEALVERVRHTDDGEASIVSEVRSDDDVGVAAHFQEVP